MKLSRRQFLRQAAAFLVLPTILPRPKPKSEWHHIAKFYKLDGTVVHYIDGKEVGTSQVNYFSRYADSLPELNWPMPETG